MEHAIRKRLKKAIAENVFPGCVIGVVHSSGKRLVVPVGRQTYDSISPEVTNDTIYDVASITKTIPVSSLALHLIDSGKLQLNDQVKVYIPELKMRYAERITPWHLLTHTLDYRIALSSLKDESADRILDEIFTREFFSEPGERFNYTNAPSILLGILIERIQKKPLDVLANEVFFAPLQMYDTTFRPESIEKKRIAPTEIDLWRRRIIQGEIHDESTFVLRKKMIAGSAGLFSTVSDLLTFLEMLLRRGSYNGRRFFSEKMTEQMATNQLTTPGEYTGLGWELYQKRFMGDSCTQHTIGKTGFTGCVVIADISKGCGMVLLSNYHYPTRKKSFDALNAVRRDIAESIF